MNNIVWNIDPIAFSLGPIEVRYYGLFFAATFLSGFYLIEWIYKREGRDPAVLDTGLVYMVVGTLVGARLGHCLFYEPDYYLSHPLEILKFWQGGLASHGGGVGIFVSLYLFCRKVNENYLWLLSRVTLPVALGGGFIRLGNFFNSEILGLPTDVPWAVVFSLVDDLPRHPTQLYESISYFIIFALLIYRYLKGLNDPAKMFGLFLIAVFSARFFLEFTKTEQAAFETGLGLSVGQMLSVPFIIAGLFFVLKKRCA